MDISLEIWYKIQKCNLMYNSCAHLTHWHHALKYIVCISYIKYVQTLYKHQFTVIKPYPTYTHRVITPLYLAQIFSVLLGPNVQKILILGKRAWPPTALGIWYVIGG